MIKPSLQPLTGETFPLLSTNTDGAQLDAKARGFYRPGQRTFFDILVAHFNARSYGGLLTETILQHAEKKRKYNTRGLEVEHGTFTPLVFGTNRAMGRECAKFQRLLAAKLAEKNQTKYSEVM